MSTGPDADSSHGRVATPLNREVPVASPGEFGPLQLGDGRVSERGQLRVWPPVILAPMAGVTNLAFRSLCREYGAGVHLMSRQNAPCLAERSHGSDYANG